MQTKCYIPALAALLCFSCGQKPPNAPTESESETTSTAADWIRPKDKEILIQWASDVINWVKAGKEEVSKHIAYPLDREYPIPPVYNEEEFLQRYDEIFDASLINRIINSDPESDDDCGYFGWRGWWFINSERKFILGYDHYVGVGESSSIHSIPYASEVENKKRQALIKLERADLYPSLRNFDYPVCLIETKKFLIRIDCINVEKEIFRYASWKKGSSISTKPDLIITNGKECLQYCGHCIDYYFCNDDYVYVVEKEGGGVFRYFGLIVYKNVKNINENSLSYLEGELILDLSLSAASREDFADTCPEMIYWSERRK